MIYMIFNQILILLLFVIVIIIYMMYWLLGTDNGLILGYVQNQLRMRIILFIAGEIFFFLYFVDQMYALYYKSYRCLFLLNELPRSCVNFFPDSR